VIIESEASDTCDLSVLGPGILYPVLQFGLRSVAQRLLRGRVSSGSLDYAGVFMLLVEMLTSAPQFYVLMACVYIVACAFPCLLLTVLAGSTGRRSSSPRLSRASRASGSELLSLLERHTSSWTLTLDARGQVGTSYHRYCHHGPNRRNMPKVSFGPAPATTLLMSAGAKPS
jgi:hypothetical protein